jgi:hypothetical protein
MKQLITILLFILQLSTTHAQEHVWKKDIGRIIPFTETKTKTAGSLLVEQLINAATGGQIQAYQNIDAFFTYPLSIERMKDLVTTKHDTITVTDPETKKEKMMVSDRIFDPELIDKYKFHEEWVFDAGNCKTSVHILGIAPAVDIYNEDGSHRATQPLVWFRYNDIKTIIANHNNAHPQNNLTTVFWKDFLRKTGIKFVSNISTGVQKVYVTRIIDVGQPDDTINYHLSDISTYTTYIEILSNAIKSGNIKAFPDKDSFLTTPLDTQTFNVVFEGPPDTIEVDDPEVHGQKKQVITRPVFNFDAVTKYKLLEEWTFDPEKGEVIIQISSIAPLLDKLDDKDRKAAKTMFWVHFEDFQKLLPAYEVYHPINTFAQKLWQSYFQTPEYVH